MHIEPGFVPAAKVVAAVALLGSQSPHLVKRPRLIVRLAASAGALFLSGGAFALQPLITDDSGTQGVGGNQLELAVTHARGGADKARDLSLVYTRGVAESVDLFAEFGRQWNESGGIKADGPTNPAVGAKWRFYENDNKTSLAIKPVYVFPASAARESDGLGSGKPSYEATLILSQEWSWGALHANLSGGRENYRDAASNARTARASVAPVWNVGERWKLAVDLGVARRDSNGVVDKARFGELGAVYSPDSDLDFAFGYVHEASRESGDVTRTATVGVTWRFK